MMTKFLAGMLLWGGTLILLLLVTSIILSELKLLAFTDVALEFMTITGAALFGAGFYLKD